MGRRSSSKSSASRRPTTRKSGCRVLRKGHHASVNDGAVSRGVPLLDRVHSVHAVCTMSRQCQECTHMTWRTTT
jgi:hypothetical protein